METPKPRRNQRRAPARQPLLYCPFTGKAFQVRHTPGIGAWIATWGRYIFGPFRTKGAMYTALSTRDGVPPAIDGDAFEVMQGLYQCPASESRPAVAEPLELCPFTRKPVQIVQDDPDDVLSRWSIRGEHYFIGGFQSRKHAEHFFSTRAGVPPTFDVRTVTSVTVPEPPEDPLEGLNVGHLKSVVSEATR